MAQGFPGGLAINPRLYQQNPVVASRAGPGAVTCSGSHGKITLTGCSTAAGAGDVTTVVTNTYVTPNSLIEVFNLTGATIAATSNPTFGVYGSPSSGSFTVRLFNSGGVAFNNGGGAATGDLTFGFIVINQ
jgi:hypothetical protein